MKDENSSSAGGNQAITRPSTAITYESTEDCKLLHVLTGLFSLLPLVDIIWHNCKLRLPSPKRNKVTICFFILFCFFSVCLPRLQAERGRGEKYQNPPGLICHFIPSTGFLGIVPLIAVPGAWYNKRGEKAAGDGKTAQLTAQHSEQNPGRFSNSWIRLTSCIRDTKARFGFFCLLACPCCRSVPRSRFNTKFWPKKKKKDKKSRIYSNGFRLLGSLA